MASTPSTAPKITKNSYTSRPTRTPKFLKFKIQNNIQISGASDTQSTVNVDDLDDDNDIKEEFEAEQISKLRDLNHRISKQIARRKSYRRISFRRVHRKSLIKRFEKLGIEVEGKRGSTVSASSTIPENNDDGNTIISARSSFSEMVPETTRANRKPSIFISDLTHHDSQSQISQEKLEKSKYGHADKDKNRNARRPTIWERTKEMKIAEKRKSIKLPTLDKVQRLSRSNENLRKKSTSKHIDFTEDALSSKQRKNTKAVLDMSQLGSGMKRASSDSNLSNSSQNSPVALPRLNMKERRNNTGIKDTFAKLPMNNSGAGFPSNEMISLTQRALAQQIMVKGYDNDPERPSDDYMRNKRLSEAFRELALCHYLR